MPKPPSKPKKSQRKASDDFESVAKRLRCDTDMDKFKEKLGKIARAKSKPHKS